MKALLKDVHHYLFNAKFSPRAGEEYQVQDHIRQLFVDQLKKDTVNTEGPHVVVSHSMGTVISYDCLKNVPDCPPVSAYMTVGCPLGISEVHDNFKPDYDKRDAFPSDKVSGDWVNVYDRLDPVAFDARISNDYQKGGNKVVIDERVHNSGKWRHSSYKYYGQQALCDHLKKLLAL
jgi:predicted alpha/beta hydrolase family esterase